MYADIQTLTFYDAERLYGEVMSSVAEIIANLDADVNDERIEQIYKSLDMTMRDIYSFALPPKR